MRCSRKEDSSECSAGSGLRSGKNIGREIQIAPVSRDERIVVGFMSEKSSAKTRRAGEMKKQNDLTSKQSIGSELYLP